MTAQERLNKAVVFRFNKEVLEEGNIDSINEIIHPEFINHTAPGSVKGPKGIIDFTVNILRKALVDIKVEIHDQVVERDKVVTRKTITGIHVGPFMGIQPSNKRVDLRIIDIIALREGQYTDHWSIRDIQDLVNKSSN
jgi:predicted ester cyclase